MPSVHAQILQIQNAVCQNTKVLVSIADEVWLVLPFAI